MNDFRKITRELKERGWVAEPTGGSHLKFTHVGTGRFVFTGSTPSDSRAIKNFLAAIRRVERELGLKD